MGLVHDMFRMPPVKTQWNKKALFFSRAPNLLLDKLSNNRKEMVRLRGRERRKRVCS